MFNVFVLFCMNKPVPSILRDEARKQILPALVTVHVSGNHMESSIMQFKGMKS